MSASKKGACKQTKSKFFSQYFNKTDTFSSIVKPTQPSSASFQWAWILYFKMHYAFLARKIELYWWGLYICWHLQKKVLIQSWYSALCFSFCPPRRQRIWQERLEMCFKSQTDNDATSHPPSHTHTLSWTPPPPPHPPVICRTIREKPHITVTEMHLLPTSPYRSPIRSKWPC